MDNVLKRIQGLPNRADVWSNLEEYLVSEPTPRSLTTQGYIDALQERIFSPLESALAPSDGNNSTGTIDGLIWVLLMGVGFLPSGDFELCPYDNERVFEKCDALGERVSNIFRVIDAVQNAAPDASMLGAMLSAPVAHLKSLDFIAHQRELFEYITQFLEREKDAE
ncbi:hypothetical protein NW759_001292 [Fusarium solani]|nr:hypothetical protein NW759_001292 [Fusarium solani]